MEEGSTYSNLLPKGHPQRRVNVAAGGGFQAIRAGDRGAAIDPAPAVTRVIRCGPNARRSRHSSAWMTAS
jgi:hypothetical protein